MITADEVLTVLNDLQPVQLGQLHFAVITAGSRQAFSVERQKFVDVQEPRFWPFERGEVLILDGLTDREPFGDMRKPGKWDVRCEWFDTFADAMACRERVLADRPRYTDEPSHSSAQPRTPTVPGTDIHRDSTDAHRATKED